MLSLFIDTTERPRVVGLVLASWFEWDADNGVDEQYARVLTRDGVLDRVFCGGHWYAVTLRDDGTLALCR